MRVVSLVPSSTETLIALGVDVVGCTRFCEQPHLTHVGGTKNPDIDAIIALDPDVVVLDREENRREDADALAAAGLSIFVSDVTTVDSALDVVRDLAALVERDAPGLVLPDQPALDVAVFVPIWRRPWMSISDATYGGALLRHMGCRLVTDGAPTPYPTVMLVDVVGMQPDVVLVPSEPYEFSDGHVRELIEAVPSALTIRVDGRDLFWWGIRTPEAALRVHATIHTAIA